MKKLIGEIKKQTLVLMTAALGFVAALIWKDAISAWLAPLYKSSDGPAMLTVAALVVTIVVIVVTIILTKLLAEPEK